MRFLPKKPVTGFRLERHFNETVYRVGDVISTYTYRQGLVEMKYSYTTAVGLFKNVISFGIILLTNFITSKFSDYGIW